MTFKGEVQEVHDDDVKDSEEIMATADPLPHSATPITLRRRNVRGPLSSEHYRFPVYGMALYPGVNASSGVHTKYLYTVRPLNSLWNYVMNAIQG
ncbi:hypothetical protein KM043_014227 [Ampulex compressa]|nr:hypothetical protein KM043_014227 [Ampulex compressa]